MPSDIFKKIIIKSPVQVSSKVYKSIETLWDQYDRNKTSTKISSTNKLMERTDENTSIDFKKWHTLLVFN